MKVQLRDDYQVPAVEAVRQALRYDPETGELRWLLSRGKAKAGEVAGVADARGYIVIGLFGKRHYAHRLAWLLMTGEWPAEVVDHIDGNRSDNRWSNLRSVAVKVNAQNRHVPAARSTTQVLGVRVFCGKFRAAISVNGKQRHLGTFDTEEQASAAYLKAKRELHEGCTL